jgi:hypothetical protein
VLWLEESYFSKVEDKGIRRIESGPRFADKVRVFVESRGSLRFAESRGGSRFKDKVVVCL